jgi:hypothetical protein
MQKRFDDNFNAERYVTIFLHSYQVPKRFVSIKILSISVCSL